MGGHEWADGVVLTAYGPLHYRTIGRGPLLIALHGIQGTAGVWTDVGSRLAMRYTVVAPNLRGRKPSVVPTERQRYSMRCFAADVRAVIEAVGEPVALIGWSMGVLVTLEYLRQGWPMPRALVLIGGTAHLADIRWFEGRSDEEVVSEARERAFRLGLTEAADPYAVAASWWHASRADYRSTLSSLQVPCLLLHGDNDDQCPPEHAEALAARLPDAELRMWPGGGHSLMGADPAGFAAAVDTFVARH
ncbi:MAG: alpha/beta fold hydrolase [Streptosporangiales bacterium]|nr:alpha/beta fold hydrolase [Streptosporangiales bacterium]